MEQKITAATRVVEILQGCQASKRTPSVDQLQVKSELTNPFRRRLAPMLALIVRRRYAKSYVLIVRH